MGQQLRHLKLVQMAVFEKGLQCFTCCSLCPQGDLFFLKTKGEIDNFCF